MKKISTSARVTEIDTFSDTLVRQFNGTSSVKTDVYLTSVIKEVESLSSELTSAILQDKVLSNLEEADNARDSAIRDLSNILKGYSSFPIKEKRDAADSILLIFDKYKKTIITENNATESSLIESMLEDFQVSEVEDACTVLEGVSETIAKIRSAQDSFNSANDEYLAATASKGKSATQIKKTLINTINTKVIPYLDAMNLSNPQVYGEFISKIEAEITRLNDTVLRRTKKEKSESELLENAKV